MSKSSDEDLLRTGGALDALAGIDADTQDPLLGRALGDYEILNLIAAGGMGRVYRARRADGTFEREVALKVSAVSGISAELRSRFSQEQSVLAGLNHPNVCQLYDADVSEEGWPYIVMELVDGETIVDYCEQHRLSSDDRLRLLVDVVDAVAYAHSRLVVHRDIKPANVLVNVDGQVKLLDFGIAKLLETDQALTRATPLTPRYASPEQLLGQPITIASDIAQLGLLIYEVLTGEALNQSETLADAIQRASDGHSLQLDLDKAQAIPREVLPIIEQCLRADPDDRYPNANSLQADLNAYLDGYPVAAVGQSSAYRFRKLVARNLPTAITAGAALLAIVLGTGWYTWQLGMARDEAEAQAVVARREAERATQVSDFLIDLFAKAEPQSAKGQEVLVRDVLDLGVQEARSGLTEEAELQAGLILTIGAVKTEMGYLDEGLPLIDEAIETYRPLDMEDPLPLVRALYQKGVNHWYAQDLPEALTAFGEGQALAELVDSNESLRQQTLLLNSMGMVASQLNDFDAAIGYHELSLDARQRYYEAGHWEIVASQLNFASVYWKRAEFEKALPLMEQAHAVANATLDPNDPRISRTAMWLGRAYLTEGDVNRAEPPLQQAVRIEGEVWGKDHGNYATALFNLGRLRLAQGRVEDAAQLFEQCVAIEQAALGPEHPYLATSMYELGDVYLTLGRLSEAETLLRDSERILLSAYPDAHRYTATATERLGRLEQLSGNTDVAINKYEQALAMMAATIGAEHPQTIRPRLAMAQLRLAKGDLAAAEADYQAAFEVMEVNRREVPVWEAYTEPYLSALSESGRDNEAAALRARLEKIRDNVIWPVSQ